MRTMNILTQLQNEFDVSVVAFSRANHQPDIAAREDAQRQLSRMVSRVFPAVAIPSEASRVRRAWDHIRSVVTGRPYIYYEYDAPSFRRYLRQALDQVPPQMIHLDSLDLYGWLKLLPQVPVACTHHDIESQLLRRRAAHLPGLLGTYVRHQASLTERVERGLAPRFDVNVMVSESDADQLRSLAPGARTVVVPNGVATDHFAPNSASSPVAGRVAFVGPTYMHANRDAVDFFLRAVWPMVRIRRKDATFVLIGRCPDEARVKYEAIEGVAAAGYVPDVRPHMAASQVCVAPLRIGGGTRLKILEAWSMGKAVVSTTVGCEGLDVVDGGNILIRDDPDAFGEAVVQLLGDTALRTRLGDAARDTAVRSYSWQVVGQRIRDAYRGLLGASGSDEAQH